jgi:hypothetical protein
MNIFLDKTAIIRRMKSIAGSDRSRLQSTATVEANIQQLDRETAERVSGVFGEDYVLFVDYSVGVQEGDQVENKDTSEKFSVKEVIKAELFGIGQFKEVYITKLDEN